ncbi:ATP-binding protein [Actinomadura keratinilytica]|uniref:ATP-binding protein n=1 Tax=Actinomadura keratinilytica TaxID=547461 RepID=UPI00360DEDA0
MTRQTTSPLRPRTGEAGLAVRGRRAGAVAGRRPDGVGPAGHTGAGRPLADAPSGRPRTARRVLPADAASPKAAREFARATLEEWGLADAVEDVLVAVSELVTNALRHGLTDLLRPAPPCPIQVVLLGHPRRLVVVVTDPGTQVPEQAEPDPDRFGEAGRGLVVVGAVSDAWGWAPLTTGGKAVWAAFDLRPASAGR